MPHRTNNSSSRGTPYGTTSDLRFSTATVMGIPVSQAPPQSYGDSSSSNNTTEVGHYAAQNAPLSPDQARLEAFFTPLLFSIAMLALSITCCCTHSYLIRMYTFISLNRSIQGSTTPLVSGYGCSSLDRVFGAVAVFTIVTTLLSLIASCAAGCFTEDCPDRVVRCTVHPSHCRCRGR